MKVIWAMICLLGVAVAPNVHAGAPASEQMQQFLDGLVTLHGNFQQTVVDETGESSRESSGQLSLSRPNRFRWDYQTPYPQQIVSDGTRIWFYDTDLEQVTVRLLGDSISSSPASFLSSDEPVSNAFGVQDVAASEGLEWVELRPHDSDSQFDKVRVGFAGGQMRKMEMLDAFGQVTRIVFSDLQRNTALAPELFRFIPPAGIDVIGP